MLIRRCKPAALAGSVMITAVVAMSGGGWPAAAATTSLWAVEPTAVLSGGGALEAVSCPSATSCVAVGYSPLGAHAKALAESWDGSAWTVQVIPSPAGARSSLLFAISCPSATDCLAAGTSISRSGAQFALTERWDGSAWTIQVTPSPAGATGSNLYGLSCFSPASCAAVGDYTDAAGNGQALAEHWDGSAWTLQATANPAPSGNTLNAVACPAAGECLAVGFRSASTSAGTFATLAERWRGGTWRLQRTPAAGDSLLTGISCPAAGSCTAVGTTSSSAAFMLGEYWNGSTWTIQPMPARPGVSVALSALSCPSRARCTAVGVGANSQGGLFATAEVSSAGTWRPQATARPAAGQALNAIWCTTAGGCTAVGGHTRGLAGQPLAEHR